MPRQTGEQLKGVLLARRGETEVRLGHAIPRDQADAACAMDCRPWFHATPRI
jgi:hypothetical protein